jgi:hypothetical protein
MSVAAGPSAAGAGEGEALMARVEDDWFAPRLLFDTGYPEGITSALRALPAVRSAVREEVRASGARLVLEIGPGDAPVADQEPGAVFMDITLRFLRALDGPRVQADLFAAPFAPGTFDLIVAADVLTHVRPGARHAALAAMADLGRDILYFNPEPGTARVADSPVRSRLLTLFFEERGFIVQTRKFVASTPGGEYTMRLFRARRG